MSDAEGRIEEAAERQRRPLHAAIAPIAALLAPPAATLGTSGRPKQSHSTANESAKLPTSQGVIQGSDGVALADSKPQVIVHAEACGEGQEHGLLLPMLEGVRETVQALELSEDIRKETQLTAAAGYASAAHAAAVCAQGLDAARAAPRFRPRAPRLHAAPRHKPTRGDAPLAKPKRALKFQPKDVQLAEDHSHALCPAGQRMYKSGGHRALEGLQTLPSRGTRGACGACARRAPCLRSPERPAVRQGAFVVGRVAGKSEKALDKRKRKIDSDVGRYEYSRRLGIIEPVFGNLRHTKRLNRFTLRSRRKVNTQWQMYCLVHNIEKLQRYGRLEERMHVRYRRTA